MRTLLLLSAAVLFVNVLAAQQKEARLNDVVGQGKVIYERIIQMEIHIDDNDEASQVLPKTRTDKFELTFGNNQSVWKHVEEEEDNDEFGGKGMQIRVVGPGLNDITFHDFPNSRKVKQREIFDKKFVVTDTIRKLNWKLTGETQAILGHACQKATAQNISKRMQMTIDNGKMERKEITDTSMVIAWFTPDIPVPAGPEMQGQLPGLILALDMNNGRVLYKAIEISPKADLASIKEPTKGKKVTPEQFTEERNKMMDEMQKNNQGGGNRIIIRN
ncbi:MAG TPA: GLPGLI family protein [Chitinophagaceae bacterium]|nr:GLPGLI family protein [Chitinophagaceae bacterium]